MKKILLSLIMTANTIIVIGQSEINLGEVYILSQNFTVFSCDEVGGNVSQVPKNLEKDFKFTVDYIDEGKDFVVVSLLPFNNKGQGKQYNNSFVTEHTYATITDSKGQQNVDYENILHYKYIYFKIDYNVFRIITNQLPKEWSLALGVPTTPVKLRFATTTKGINVPFLATSNTSLGLSLAITKRFGGRNQIPITILLGTSITSIEIDSSTSQGQILTKTNASAFSPLAGLMLSSNDIEIGLFVGWDLFSGELNQSWLYQNKPWLGLGLGINIFAKDGTAKNQ